MSCRPETAGSPRSLERLIESSPAGRAGGLDLSQLCVVSGKTAWVVYLDALLLDVGGNLHDVLSAAAKVGWVDGEGWGRRGG